MSSIAAKKGKDELDKIRQELFCKYYTQNDSVFGNATLCYAEAYGYNLDELSKECEYNKNGKLVNDSDYNKAKNVCGVEGFRLLKNPKIQERLTFLLNEHLKDDIVDSQLAKIILQDEDTSSKVRAIGEYNKLRGRITDKQKHSFEGISSEDLARQAAEIIAGLVSDQSGVGDKGKGKQG